MAGKRRKAPGQGQKQKAEEREDRRKALLSPDSLEIRYGDLRRGGVLETKPLGEFLRWAREEKLAIFSKAYRDYAIYGKMPTVEADAKLWCPCIETDCMIPENIAEEFFPYRNTMYVDESSKLIYKEGLRQVVTREAAFRSHRRLMREETSGCEENTANQGSEGSTEKGNSSKEQMDCNVQDMANEDKGAPKDPEPNNSEKNTKQLADSEEDIVPNMANTKPKADTETDTELNMAKTEQMSDRKKDREPDAKDKADADALDEWKLIIAQGKAVPLNQVIMQVLEVCKSTASSVMGLEQSVVGLEQSVVGLKQSVDGLYDEIKAAHKSISDNGESIVRASLGIFLGELWKSSGKHISVPVFGRKLPYVPFGPLEQLATLCLKSNNKTRSPPSQECSGQELYIFDSISQNICYASLMCYCAFLQEFFLHISMDIHAVCVAGLALFPQDVAKAVRDGGIETSVDHANGWMQSAIHIAEEDEGDF